jgi:hypothetical protein
LGAEGIVARISRLACAAVALVSSLPLPADMSALPFADE